MGIATKDRLRLQIAQTAARIVVEEGVHDFATARRKAAARLGCDGRNLPKDAEIEQALAEYHRLYRADEQADHVGHLRQLAAEAMRFLAEFSPLLVGGVWEGHAGPHSPITLHVFALVPEDVVRKLLNAKIPFQQSDRSMALADGQSARFPMLSFVVDDAVVELLILPFNWQRHRPKSKEGAPAGGGLTALLERTAQDRPRHR